MNKSDSIAQYYDRRVTVFGRDFRSCDYRCRWSFVQRQRAVIEILSNLKGKKILDVGCGPGIFTSPLASANCLVGVDLSTEMVKLAEASLRPVRGDGRFLPFKDESFDVVLALEILPDISDLQPFLKELSRVTRTGGQLIVSAINKNSLLHKMFIRFGGGYENFNFHSLQAIYGILQEEALLPVETKFIGFPFPVVWGSHRKSSVLSALATSWVVQCVKNSTGERSRVAS